MNVYNKQQQSEKLKCHEKSNYLNNYSKIVGMEAITTRIKNNKNVNKNVNRSNRSIRIKKFLAIECIQ